jgi:hypothetical protein
LRDGGVGPALAAPGRPGAALRRRWRCRPRSRRSTRPARRTGRSASRSASA